MIHPRGSSAWGIRPTHLATTALVSFVLGAVASDLAHARSGDESPHAAVQQLGTVLALVESAYVDPVERDKITEGAIKGMVGALDPHSSYMTRDDYVSFNSDSEGRFGGIGIEVEIRDGWPVVIAPIEGSPAEKAGVQSGDKIVRVEGESTQGIALQTLVTRMRGEPGTHVSLTFVRGTEPERTISLERRQIQTVSVKGRRLKDDIAYLRVKQFQHETYPQFLRALAGVRAASNTPITGVILDLRNNTGGFVDQATGIADEFLTDGGIFSARHRDRIVENVQATSGGALTSIPVVVLVNEYSASASELLAGALQDNHRATIVGALTFGKGSVQTIFDLPNGAGMRLTTMRYYTPAGRSIQGAGVTPDVVVPSPPGEVVRERDLDGALPPEDSKGFPIPIGSSSPSPASSSSHPTPPAAPSSSALAADAGVDPKQQSELDASEFGVSREPPYDPTKGSDRALKVGFETVLKLRLTHR